MATALGLLLLPLFAGISGEIAGRLLPLPRKQGFLLGLLAVIGFQLVLGSIFFYLWRLPGWLLAIQFLLTFPLLLSLERRYGLPPYADPPPEPTGVRRLFYPLAALSFILSSTLTILLFVSRTWDATPSPWLQIPTIAFVLFFLLVLTTTLALAYRPGIRLTMFLLASLLIPTLGVATLIFPLGYGFDLFVHEATIRYIALHGTVTPKPPYYLGAYVLELIGNELFLIPLHWINTWVVPVLASVLIPAVYVTFPQHILWPRGMPLGHKMGNAISFLLGISMLPLSAFILSTPQQLADLFFFVVVWIAVSVSTESRRTKLALAIVSLATLLIHPIAGIPLLCFLCIRFVTSNTWGWIFTGVGSVLLPLVFFLFGLLKHQPIHFTWPHVSNLQGLIPDGFLTPHFGTLWDFVGTVGPGLLFLLGTSCAWMGIRTAHIVGGHRRDAVYRVSTGLATMLVINFLLLRFFLAADFLPDSERFSYADRLLPLILLSFSPILFVGASRLLEYIMPLPRSMKTILLVLLCLTLTVHWYRLYPRQDGLTRSHLYNVSQNDLDGARFIEGAADGRPYIVLGDQAVSAAALSLYGFERTMGPHYFYPIPNGSPLSEWFLKMNEKPSAETADGARTFINAECARTGCNTPEITLVYFLVHDYWWDATRIRETAKTNAATVREIDGGKIVIFGYEF
ncbi:hypothetical protein HYV73_04800 [Candidatus Uhrbacteria bacterium]|nr:hypothetical protein [Candidatus Uhrbacteria bacterium]